MMSRNGRTMRLISAWTVMTLATGFGLADKPGVPGGNHYFIAQNHPGASDDNPGTEAQPFKTIEGGFEALSAVIQPGDSIWIREGLYRRVHLHLNTQSRPDIPTVVFPSGDGFSRMISIQAYPGEKPVINQALVVEGWTPYRDAVWVTEFPGETRHVFPVTFVDGRPLRQIGGTVRRNPEYWAGKYGESLEDIESGSFYFDEEENKLYVWLENDADPNAHLMEAYADGPRLGFGPGLRYLRIAGLTIRYGGIGLQASYSILEDIDQSWAPFSGCFLAWEFNTVIRCRFNHNGNNGMGGRGRGHRIIDSETNHNNWRRWRTGWHAGGVKFIPYWHDIVLKGHTAAYNHGDGIWFDARMSNVTIEDCIAYRNEGAGIHYEIGTRGVIKNNILYENGHRGIYLSNASYTAVLNNLCYRNGMSGIAVIGVERGGGPHGRGENRYTPGGHNVVWGNILVDNCWDASRDLERFPGWGGRPELIMPSDREGNQGNVSDYNVFFRTGSRGEALERLTFARNWDVGYAHGLDDWREKTGWDRNSIVADPAFVDAGEYDFRLAEGSPALWMVKELDDSMSLDFNGQERSRVIQSAGPFEGDLRELARIQSNPPAGKHRLFPLQHRGGRPRGESINFARHARAVLHRDLAEDMGFGLSGVRVDDIPFLRASMDYVVLDDASPEAVLPLGDTVQKLHLLLSAENTRPDVPLVEAAITRADGFTVRLVWQQDSEGAWSVQPQDATETRLGHAGEFPRIPKDPPGSRIYVTTWNNENEWYPLERVTFTLLDTEAQVFFLGVTGENDAR